MEILNSHFLHILSNDEDILSVQPRFIVVICQNQLTIFIHIRSATIADYTVIKYLLQALAFLAKIGVHGIISGSKNSKLIFLDYKLLTHHMKRYLTGLFDILTYLRSIRFSIIPLINFIQLL